MNDINLTLPYPPSVNHYWGERAVLAKANFKKGKKKIRRKPKWIVIKYLTRRAKDFRMTVGEICYEQFDGKLPKLRGRLQITVYEYFGPLDEFKFDRGKAQDIDNCLKPLFDALQHAKIYIDDEQIDALLVIKKRRAAVGRVEVKVQHLGD